MEDEKINILIVGHGKSAQALKQKLESNTNAEKVFVSDNIDLRENDETGLLKFALENNINMTIPISMTALNSDIVSFFQANGQNIFGPNKKSCQITLNKIQGKKFLYKIHAQTPKFGIFDKTQQALDYLKTANFPVIISTSDGKDSITCTTISLASQFLNETINFHGETDILIEEYTYGHNFTVYFITDGYGAIPFASVGEYKYSTCEKAGAKYGKGCYIPDFRVSQTVISRLENIVNNTLKTLDNKENPYSGILGIKCILTGEDKFVVKGFKPFFEDFETEAILRTIDEDLIKLFYSCINGYFSDEYNQIQTNDICSVSTTIKHNNKVLTQSARTIKRAKELLSEEIEDIIVR